MAESNVRELAAVLGEKLSLTADEDVGLDLDEGTPATQTGGESKWCLLGTLRSEVEEKVKMDTQLIQRQVLLCRPADHHESSMLELPRAWEPSSSSMSH
ncbi:hypothetical protein SLA2020_186690 [Shorea laevis]